jgi:TRAP transporter TAXI family solute receptor
VLEATAGQRRQVRFIPIVQTDAVKEKTPYYVDGVIAVALYPKAANTEDVPTIGVLTVLVTSAAEPDATVYAVTKALFENLERFKNQHAALKDLDPREMVTRGLYAPLHPGAEAYFREAGLKP